MASIQTKKIKDRIKNNTFDAIKFYIKDGEGDPVDITGLEVRIQIRQGSKTGAVVKSCSVGDGITIVDAAAGYYIMDEFTPIPWEADVYYGDALNVFSATKQRTYAEWSFNVLQNVSD